MTRVRRSTSHDADQQPAESAPGPERPLSSLWKRCRGLLLPAALLASLGGCATAPGPSVLSQEEWSQALAERGVETADLRNPVLASEEMTATARQVAGDGGPLEQLERLQAYLFDASTFEFDYRARRTLTATEAFSERGGNCVSFTNMFIAMGRALGIEVEAALAQLPRETETLGSLVLVNSHVVAMVRHSQGRVVYDFDRLRERKPIGYTPIDDVHLTAIFLNNVGAERLIAERPEEAIAYFDDASRLAPDLVATYANLGVAFQRIGALDGALDSYLLALQLEPRDLSTRNNLLGLFAQKARERQTDRGDSEPASTSDLEELLATGDADLAAGRPAKARERYLEAVKLDRSNPEPHVSLARILLYQGSVRAAQKRLVMALELEQDHVEATRLLRGLGFLRARR